MVSEPFHPRVFGTREQQLTLGIYVAIGQPQEVFILLILYQNICVLVVFYLEREPVIGLPLIAFEKGCPGV